MKIWGVVGWKNSGKTTLVAGLVAEFARRGLSVSTVKHAHHTFEIDHAGTDSFRHRKAGAREVLLGSSRRWALIHELNDEPEPSLNDLLARLGPVDLVLIEGFKSAPHPKIEVLGEGGAEVPVRDSFPAVKAVASDVRPDNALPWFARDDVAGIADFVAAELGL